MYYKNIEKKYMISFKKTILIQFFIKLNYFEIFFCAQFFIKNQHTFVKNILLSIHQKYLKNRGNRGIRHRKV